ncbi:EF-hand domain-containing protein [Crateriforma conspicua]|uniref:EF-hand domain-containing protein n=1 Tax=Crateriforma conspicua TaxID=2527996 RepID=A0A5C5Y7Z1_9PLAN|nr:hypothetical protein [Crateriforma conspicua]TWT71796.1 hypothetical protein Pan14r_41130 [Crateriforma conspicua]
MSDPNADHPTDDVQQDPAAAPAGDVEFTDVQAGEPVTTTEAATPEPAAEKPKSNVRQYVLLGVLALLLAALGYDYKVARPQVDEAFAKVESKAIEFGRKPDQFLSNDIVQSTLGFAPMDTFMEGSRKVEVYGFQSGLPLRKHKMYVTYKPFEGRDMYLSHQKYVYEEQDIQGNMVAGDDGTLTVIDEYSGEVISSTPGGAVPGAPEEMDGGSGGGGQPPAAGGDDSDYQDMEPAADGGDQPADDSTADEEPAVAEARPAPAASGDEEEEGAIIPGSAEWVRFEALIAKYDSDGDGLLAGDELTEDMKSQLDKVDIDNNDALDIEEIIIFARAKAAAKAAAEEGN